MVESDAVLSILSNQRCYKLLAAVPEGPWGCVGCVSALVPCLLGALERMHARPVSVTAHRYGATYSALPEVRGASPEGTAADAFLADGAGTVPLCHAAPRRPQLEATAGDHVVATLYELWFYHLWRRRVPAVTDPMPHRTHANYYVMEFLFWFDLFCPWMQIMQ